MNSLCGSSHNATFNCNNSEKPKKKRLRHQNAPTATKCTILNEKYQTRSKVLKLSLERIYQLITLSFTNSKQIITISKCDMCSNDVSREKMRCLTLISLEFHRLHDSKLSFSAAPCAMLTFLLFRCAFFSGSNHGVLNLRSIVHNL